jgi:deoxyribonuclease V
MTTINDALHHRWDLTPEEAVALQKELAARVDLTNTIDAETVQLVAGIDASYRDIGRAAIVVLRLPDFEVVDTAVATAEVNFPYVPGLLSFRETPVVLAAMEKLIIRPEVLMLDGQGVAHPRRFGIACHVGLLTGIPAIGVAKSVLTGRYENLGETAGDSVPLTYRGTVIGTALRSKPRTNALILSPGYKIDLETSVALVRRCLKGYRLPEPTRQAHNLAGKAEKDTPSVQE